MTKQIFLGNFVHESISVRIMNSTNFSSNICIEIKFHVDSIVISEPLSFSEGCAVSETAVKLVYVTKASSDQL